MRRRRVRRLGSWVVNAYVRSRFDIPFRDTQGVRMFRRSAAERSALVSGHSNFFADTEFLIRAHRARLVVEEIPVTVVDFRPTSTVNVTSLVEFWRDSQLFAQSCAEAHALSASCLMRKGPWVRRA